MKKTLFLILTLVAVVMTGCNEKDLIHNISGNWHVSSYKLNGANQTYWYDTTYVDFKWSFTSDKKYTKTWERRRIGTVYTVDTVRHFDSISQTTVIDSITSTSAVVPFVYTYDVPGTWLLINGNQYLETRDSLGNTEYQILDHSNSSLHLYTGNEDIILSK